MKRSQYTKELLTEAALRSHNMADVLRYLGIGSYSGGMSTYLRGRLDLFEIDHSHFVGNRYCERGLHARKDWKAILVYNAKYRQSGRRLRNALIESGVPYICSECNCSPVWKGKKLTLEVDHIDGIWANNVPSNLRFLCPNCHSQMPTSSNAKYITIGCVVCHSEFQAKQRQNGQVTTEYCSSSCRNSNGSPRRPRKGSWPSPEVLRNLVWSNPVAKVSKLIGVSGVAVKRMCTRFNIKTPPRGYWSGGRHHLPNQAQSLTAP